MSDQEELGCIVGAVVQLHQKSSEHVCQYLSSCDGVDVHARDDQDRLVITIEASTSRAAMHLSEEIQNLKGVLHLTPVYQYCEESPQEEQLGGWRWR